MSSLVGAAVLFFSSPVWWPCFESPYPGHNSCLWNLQYLCCYKIQWIYCFFRNIKILYIHAKWNITKWIKKYFKVAPKLYLRTIGAWSLFCSIRVYKSVFLSIILRNYCLFILCFLCVLWFEFNIIFIDFITLK